MDLSFNMCIFGYEILLYEKIGSVRVAFRFLGDA